MTVVNDRKYLDEIEKCINAEGFLLLVKQSCDLKQFQMTVPYCFQAEEHAFIMKDMIVRNIWIHSTCLKNYLFPRANLDLR